ncbi:MAG: excinuclease ABC subunit UvrA [Planctomycetaceae bacterium]|nr:excinuclease ABC subunit UvrA [Planctomycetaceae bacterium]
MTAIDGTFEPGDGDPDIQNSSIHNSIHLEGVRVHNLRNLTLNVPCHKLTVICGVSGSGKSSLAFDTLYAEGQRRYIETFSPYARQFLDRIERPAVDRIDGIPPAVAIRQDQRNAGSRSTVGTRTELLNYLRLLFTRAADCICPDCDVPVNAFTPTSASQWLLRHASGQRAMIAFEQDFADDPTSSDEKMDSVTRLRLELESLQSRGFTRVIRADKILRVEDCLELIAPDSQANPPQQANQPQQALRVVVDRIRIDAESPQRIEESIEAAFAAGDGKCIVLIPSSGSEKQTPYRTVSIDNSEWMIHRFSRELQCDSCHRSFAMPVPESLNFNSPLGACANCEGYGNVSTMTLEKVVPDDSLSIREGAIAPWNSPAYEHERQELIALAKEYGLPVDKPFRELNNTHRQIILDGVPERNFGGLRGFHRWLVRHRYKMGVRVFLNRWRSWVPCHACQGSRLNADSAVLILAGRRFTDILCLELSELMNWLNEVVAGLSEDIRRALRSVIEHLTTRLTFLLECGLGYLALDRSMRSLSGGEAQRVVLTAALGSGLINTLYVLDEPTTGLHGSDTQMVIQATRQLTTAGNTLVVVEHDPQFIMSADHVIEIGPAAGENGGNLIFEGAPARLLEMANSVTACKLREFLHSDETEAATHDAGTGTPPTPRTIPQPSQTLRIPQYWLTLTNVQCHNICGLDARIPLQVIVAVTGVSGSGKSSLLVDSLYPALCRHLGQACDHDSDGTIEQLLGAEEIDSVVLLDQSPLQKSTRSIPVTWIGAFDDIRKLMAETHEARKRNFAPGTFSFNSARGGRCEVCEGLGIITVEMQFLADIQTTCEQCQGRRFRPDVLEVRYRDRSIFDILQMTSDEAFAFFNGHKRIQQRLNAMRQAGLGYLRLGQPLSTLSGGEAQRLRIASLLAGVPLSETESATTDGKKKRGRDGGRSLFILDEPSTGLHMDDIDRLMTCLNYLVQTGHSVVLIEHDDYLLSKVDYTIQMGPGAGRAGGRII